MSIFEKTRAQFALPEGMIYLDGNSLGPPVRATAQSLTHLVEAEWQTQLIKAWNSCDWISRPSQVGDRIAKLIGAPAGTVVMGDTLSIKVFQALAAGLAMNLDRRIILSDNGNFPTDLYIAEGLIALKARGYSLKTVAPEDVEAHLNADVAVLMLTEVDYRTGRKHDMHRLTQLAHQAGIVTVWDLAHSAGAFPVHLADCNTEFAVGCTYKYLNGGPGSPAFIYVRSDLGSKAVAGLSGWMGHAAPFDFELNYRPRNSVERMRVGTPPILALAALQTSLSVFEQVSMEAIRQRSVELTELFIAEMDKRLPQLELATPRNSALRGSQVSYRHPQAYAVMQALIAQNLIGDVRAPDILRFGFTPLYINAADVRGAVEIIANVINTESWKNPVFSVRSAVT